VARLGLEAGFGAVAAYLFDPEQGEARRARAAHAARSLATGVRHRQEHERVRPAWEELLNAAAQQHVRLGAANLRVVGGRAS
jgi:effector-binding domain-containing protein